VPRGGPCLPARASAGHACPPVPGQPRLWRLPSFQTSKQGEPTSPPPMALAEGGARSPHRPCRCAFRTPEDTTWPAPAPHSPPCSTTHRARGADSSPGPARAPPSPRLAQPHASVRLTHTRAPRRPQPDPTKHCDPRSQRLQPHPTLIPDTATHADWAAPVGRRSLTCRWPGAAPVWGAVGPLPGRTGDRRPLRAPCEGTPTPSR